jgi:hypothetical protein
LCDLREEMPLIPGDRQRFITALFCSGLLLPGCSRLPEEGRSKPASSSKSGDGEGFSEVPPEHTLNRVPVDSSGALKGQLVGASGQNSLEDKSRFLPDRLVIEEEHAGARFDLAGAKVLDASGNWEDWESTSDSRRFRNKTGGDARSEIYDDFQMLYVFLSIRTLGQRMFRPMGQAAASSICQLVRPKPRENPPWTFRRQPEVG